MPKRPADATMRVLLACVLIAVAAAEKQRVVFRTGKLVETREEAIQECMDYKEHIAHEAQLIMDVNMDKDSKNFTGNYASHAKCGWSWTRGRPVHVHCLETIANGKRCKPGKAEIRLCPKKPEATLPPPAGVYCRQFSDEETRPEFEVKDGELVEIYRATSPLGHNKIMNVNEAIAVCTGEGNTLAYWSQLAAYIERYDIQICHFSWLREPNAVFNGNCKHTDVIEWDVRDKTRGYDAICYGHIPHKYQDPCAGENGFMRNLEGIPVYCSDDDYIIIQDRVACSDEVYGFKRELAEYEFGFGEVGKGYWLGLKYLAKITKAYNFELVIELVDDKNNTFVAKYDHFCVSGPEDKYTLKVGEYTGDAGDMFNEPQSDGLMTNGAKFSTTKFDNDGILNYNCALEYASGWWFQSCHVDNLNGPCPGEEAYNVTLAATRTWKQLTHEKPGLISTRMKIKYVSDEKH